VLSRRWRCRRQSERPRDSFDFPLLIVGIDGVPLHGLGAADSLALIREGPRPLVLNLAEPGDAAERAPRARPASSSPLRRSARPAPH
jgi:hypothetical protein